MAAILTMIAIQASIFLLVLGAVIYAIVKRIESKRNETFEDRDN
jgi:heme/copper-type cytochrome/quinol oxidase subunit 2